MKIGILSDTHLEAPNSTLEKIIGQYFGDTDLILHAGDLISLDVLEAFSGKEVIAVAGNSDPQNVHARLPEKEIIQAGGFKIGLIHGWGIPLGIEKRLASAFDGVDGLVFGHSHRPVNHYRNGILFFNPGAFSGGIFSLWRRTVGILQIDKNIRGEIIRI